MDISKKLFIERLLRERDKFELLLNRIGYTRQMTMKGVSGKWSIKDILAHILSYEQYMADRMHEILHQQVYVPSQTQAALEAFAAEFGYPDFGSTLIDNDAPNSWVVEKYKNVSLDDVITQELQAFASIIAGLEAMTEATITQHDLTDQIARHTYKHYREHIKDIRAWLNTNAVNSKNS